MCPARPNPQRLSEWLSIRDGQTGRSRSWSLVRQYKTGCGAAWLARLTGGQEVPGSNPGSPTTQAFSGSTLAVMPGHHARGAFNSGHCEDRGQSLTSNYRRHVMLPPANLQAEVKSEQTIHLACIKCSSLVGTPESTRPASQLSTIGCGYRWVKLVRRQ